MVPSAPKPAALFFPSGVLLSWALNVKIIVRLHMRSQKTFRSQNVHVLWEVGGADLVAVVPGLWDVSSCCKGPCLATGEGMFPSSAHCKPSLDTRALLQLLG